MVDKANAALLQEIEASEGGAVEVVGVCGMGAKPKPLTAWYGGKARLAPIIARMIERIPHTTYIEPFSGMCGVLMAKRPSEKEVINDKFDGLINLFRIVRNPATCEELVRRLELTPYARAEWRLCYDGWQTETDPIEQARMMYVALQQNFVGNTEAGSWSFGGGKHSTSVAQEFINSLVNIRAVCQRLRHVIIDNADALNVMRQWGTEESVSYEDPPYLQETRNSTGYRHEMATHAAHLAYLENRVQANGAVIISGYPSQLYTDILEDRYGWTRFDFSAVSSAAMQSEANGRKNNPKARSTKRTECLWLNPRAARYQTPTLIELMEAAS